MKDICIFPIFTGIFTTAKKLKQSNCPLGNEMDKETMVYNGLLPSHKSDILLTYMMNLEDTMLSEKVRERQIFHIYVKSKS